MDGEKGERMGWELGVLKGSLLTYFATSRKKWE